MADPRASRAGRRARWRLVFLGDLALDVVLRPDTPLALGTDVPGRVEFRAELLHVPAYSLLSDALLPAAQRAVALARANGALVSIDLASRGPLLAHGRREVLRRIERLGPDLLLGNEFEVRVLAAARGPQALLDLAPVVCVKRGSEGCALWARSSVRGGATVTLEVLASKVPTADTTGAGDAFDAGFLLAWLDARAAGVALPVALRRAALAGNRAAARHLATPRRELVP